MVNFSNRQIKLYANISGYIIVLDTCTVTFANEFTELHYAMNELHEYFSYHIVQNSGGEGNLRQINVISQYFTQPTSRFSKLKYVRMYV